MSERRAAPERLAWAAALAGVTVLAAVARFSDLAAVPRNTFYDAAVRSMSQSWHNLLFGAFDPSASASIDKPPFDLWLQVVSVRIFGFHSASLKYPSALAATLAVPLLYDLVRRLAGRPAALASAFTLAILPISVLTSRSDTMDSLMMALLVLCAWLVVRSAETGQRRWLLLAAFVLGLDFNVKLFEPLIAAPALVLLAGIALRPRLRDGAAVVAVFLVTALGWMAFVSLAPDRPYPIGSSDGSIWNAVFVYNGIDRVTQTPHPDRFSAPSASARPTGAYEVAMASGRLPAPGGGLLKIKPPRRRRAPVQAPAGPLRLFDKSSQDYGGIVGVELLAGLLFGGLALALGHRELRGVQRAAVAGVALWLLSGLVLFSAVGRLHPRYLEAFTPAVAVAAGVGAMALARRDATSRAILCLAGALAIVFLEGVRITGVGKIVSDGRYAALLLTAVALVAMVVALALARDAGGRWPRWLDPRVLGALALIAIAPFALARDLRLIRHHNGDQALSPSIPSSVVGSLSDYLKANQGGARYEVASSAPSLVAPLIIRDGRPVALLTTVDARPLVTLSRLQQLAASGQVRYVLTRGRCPVPRNHKLAACSAAVEWVMAHGRDVTAAAAPGQSQLLYRIG
jgi:4-amino-4-deoxy-L-arabinose transferase-like glycosyltransferase